MTSSSHMLSCILLVRGNALENFIINYCECKMPLRVASVLLVSKLMNAVLICNRTEWLPLVQLAWQSNGRPNQCLEESRQLLENAIMLQDIRHISWTIRKGIEGCNSRLWPEQLLSTLFFSASCLFSLSYYTRLSFSLTFFPLPQKNTLTCTHTCTFIVTHLPHFSIPSSVPLLC